MYIIFSYHRIKQISLNREKKITKLKREREKKNIIGIQFIEFVCHEIVRLTNIIGEVLQSLYSNRGTIYKESIKNNSMQNIKNAKKRSSKIIFHLFKRKNIWRYMAVYVLTNPLKTKKELYLLQNILFIYCKLFSLH